MTVQPTMNSESMFVSHNREKLINALVYFLGTTNHAHTLKLFKLLNFSDFEHFRQTGRTITGLEYKALPMGPVPTSLFDELKKGGNEDLKKAIQVVQVKDDITDATLRRDLKAKIEFDSKYFTKRELDILKLVAEFFRDLKADSMSEFSHMKGMPWNKIYQNGKGSGRIIPSDLALEADALNKDVPTIEKTEFESRRELLA